MGTNLRGLWICSREVLKHMMAQEPLPTHDGRPGCRGSIVNLGSNLGLVSKDGTRAFRPRFFWLVLCPGANVAQRRIMRPNRRLSVSPGVMPLM